MQLADDDAFRAVDDECSLRSHQRQFAHENFFFLGPLLFLQQKRDVQRSAVGNTFSQTFEPVIFRFADVVTVKIKDAFAIITFDRKHLGENRLQSRILARAWRSGFLQEIAVGIGLQFNEVRRSDDLFDFPEVDSFSYFGWHFGPLISARRRRRTVIVYTTQGKPSAFSRKLAASSNSILRKGKLYG